MTNGGSDGKNHPVVSNYPPPPQQQVATGYPMPAVAPPPSAYNNASVQPNPQAYPVTQAPPGPAAPNASVVSQGRDDLPCCGLGLGWLLFILGFLLGVIPWYIGFILLLCNKEPREKAGYIACSVASTVATIIIVVSVVISARG